MCELEVILGQQLWPGETTGCSTNHAKLRNSLLDIFMKLRLHLFADRSWKQWIVSCGSWKMHELILPVGRNMFTAISNPCIPRGFCLTGTTFVHTGVGYLGFSGVTGDLKERELMGFLIEWLNLSAIHAGCRQLWTLSGQYENALVVNGVDHYLF